MYGGLDGVDSTLRSLDFCGFPMAVSETSEESRTRRRDLPTPKLLPHLSDLSAQQRQCRGTLPPHRGVGTCKHRGVNTLDPAPCPALDERRYGVTRSIWPTLMDGTCVL